jgi:hypothetical protein
MAGVGGSAAKGALGGASAGLAIGANPLLMAATGGLSAPVGAAVGAVAGGVSSGIKANKAKKADERIQAQDPMELARLAEINRIRKSIGAGTDPLTQNAIRQAQQTGASTQGNIARVTGGNVGATVAGMTRAQRGTQAATNQAVVGAAQRLPFFENMAQQLGTRISQRSLEVGLMRRDQAMAEKAAQGKADSANIEGALGTLGNMTPGAGAGTGASQPPLAVKQDVGFNQQSNGFISEGAPGVDKSVFNIDDDDPINVEQRAPSIATASVSASPIAGMSVGNPNDQIFGSDPKLNPFAQQMGNPYQLGNAQASDPNYNSDIAKAAEAQRLAELEANARSVFPDERR